MSFLSIIIAATISSASTDVYTIQNINRFLLIITYSRTKKPLTRSIGKEVKKHKKLTKEDEIHSIGKIPGLNLFERITYSFDSCVWVGGFNFFLLIYTLLFDLFANTP